MFTYRKKTAFYQTIITLFSIFSQVLYVLATLILIYKEYVTVGSIVGVLGISQSVYTSINQVFGSISILAGITPIFQRLLPNGFLQERPFQEKESLSIASIELKDLSVSYGDKKILEHFSMEFVGGKKYAVIGSSGSGKSTLLKVLLKEKSFDGGEVRINGRPMEEIPAHVIYSSIGFVAQDPYVFNLSIRENITLGEDFSEEKIRAAIQRAELESFIASLPNGLDTVIEHNGANISGGQKQRIVLAREYVRGKNFLLMDEGTGSLDNKTKMAIEHHLLSDPDLTLIYVLHPRTKEELTVFDQVIELGPQK
ncbi:MAG: ABC transporter ATP-binding protein [Tissierellia bacterium]|nr:ABC transporter ATP-binding protein [Tissierellia bacterium]